MSVLFQRFLGFDRLLGPTLVRIVYYVAAAFIVIMVGVWMFMGLMAVVAGNFGSGRVLIVAAPAMAPLRWFTGASFASSSCWRL